MTSKLIERLINKEYLTERERKEWLNAIKERLEVLEKEKTELLLAHSKVLKSSSETNSLTLDILKENEKLKKEKEQIKEWVVNKIKYLDKGVFLMSYERAKGAIEILNELLKEVLGE